MLCLKIPFGPSLSISIGYTLEVDANSPFSVMIHCKPALYSLLELKKTDWSVGLRMVTSSSIIQQISWCPCNFLHGSVKSINNIKKVILDLLCYSNSMLHSALVLAAYKRLSFDSFSFNRTSKNTVQD